jgi:hypothetical protein
MKIPLFFQGSAAPADPLAASADQGSAMDVQAPGMDQNLPQQEVEQPSPSVTLGEIRDSVGIALENTEDEPQTLETTEMNINDAFNKRFGTTGALQLDDEDSAPAEPVMQDVAGVQPEVSAAQEGSQPSGPQQEMAQPASEMAHETSVENQSQPQEPVAEQRMPEPTIEPEELQSVEAPQVQTENPAADVADGGMEAPKTQMNVQDQSVPEAEEGSVEDRKERLKNLSQKITVQDDSGVAETPVDEGPQNGAQANPDILDL